MSGASLPPFVDAAELAGIDDVVVADVRWYLDGRSGRAAYESGHLPGAVFVDLDDWLAAAPSPDAGRHPLPDPEVFAAGMRSIGAGDATPVVAYDDSGGVSAGRLVWMLRRLGHPAALLDGGIDAWPGPRSTTTPRVRPGTFTARPWPVGALATIDEVAAAAPGTVIDVRAAERYRGEHEPIDPRAGHVPGARNLPLTGVLDERRRLRDASQLSTYLSAVAPDAILHCGSGVSACLPLLALESIGRTGPRLWPGSWSQWASDSDRPVATGT